MNYEDNPKSIKYHVKQFLLRNQSWYNGKSILDFPAGNGVTSRILKEIGATPLAYDLFPEYFQEADIECRRANIRDGLPLEDSSVDGIICQEGIEHFSDQYHAMKEFSRVCEKGGKLLITTPNYSNLRSRLSYLLSESERYHKHMPPNLVDSIWMNDDRLTDEVYFGHIFLIGMQKLRLLANLNGFEIESYALTKYNGTSMWLFPILYPFILASNIWAYRKNIRKKRMRADFEEIKQVYKETLSWSVNPRVLIGSNLMVSFIKKSEPSEVIHQLRSKHTEFAIT